jgi:hypothetical protein
MKPAACRGFMTAGDNSPTAEDRPLDLRLRVRVADGHIEFHWMLA